MAYETVIVDQEDHLGTITLNRPEQLNTFNNALARELEQAFKELDSEQDVRVVILKGAGKVFCAGIDVSELEGQTPLEYQEWISRMELPLANIAKLKTPVIFDGRNLHNPTIVKNAGIEYHSIGRTPVLP